MIRQSVRRALLVGCACSVLVAMGCSTSGHKRAARAATSLGKARAELVQLRELSNEVLVKLADLMEDAGRDPKREYAAYTKAVGRFESRAGTVRKRAEQIKARGEAYFASWGKELEAISDAELYGNVTRRKASVQESYQETVRSMALTAESLDQFAPDLNDIKTAVGNDLTPGGISSVRDVGARAQAHGKVLIARIDAVIAELDFVEDMLAP